VPWPTAKGEAGKGGHGYGGGGRFGGRWFTRWEGVAGVEGLRPMCPSLFAAADCWARASAFLWRLGRADGASQAYRGPKRSRKRRRMVVNSGGTGRVRADTPSWAASSWSSPRRPRLAKSAHGLHSPKPWRVWVKQGGTPGDSDARCSHCIWSEWAPSFAITSADVLLSVVSSA